MSNAFSSLFGIAQAQAGSNFINSYDAGAPGGVVQVPVSPRYQSLFPGATGLTPGAVDGSTAAAEEQAIQNLGTMTITPGATPAPSSSTGPVAAGPGLDVNGNPCSSMQSYFGLGGCGAQNADGTAGSVSSGGISGAIGALTGASMSSAMTWIEELAIRALLVLVGITLIGAGFYVAGQRGKGNIVVRVVNDRL